MASVLKVNTLTGVTTAGSIVVTGEGNSTATNLQQGLAKAWVNWKGTDTVGLNGSFNVSSGADLGTANYQINYSNVMGNVNYSVGLGTNRQDDSGDHTFSNFYANTTSLLKGRAFNTGASALDQAKWTANIHGDLA